MAPNKDKLLNKDALQKNGGSVLINLPNKTIEISIDSLAQFLFDLDKLDDDIVYLPNLLNEFKEFLNDYYPDEAPSVHLKKYNRLLVFIELFKGEMGIKEIPTA
jgi:hypothetical protein